MRRTMRNRLLLGAGALTIATSLYLVFGVFGVQKLFVDEAVNEDFEVAAERSPEKKNSDTPPATTSVAKDPEDQPVPRTPATKKPAAAEKQKQQKEQNKQSVAQKPVAEEPEPEPAGPVAVSSGQFHPVDHAGAGTAIVYRQPDGSHVLRLEGLNVENGPDLYVYAIAAADATDEASALEAGFVSAGRLKGNIGNQTYVLPPDYDPDTHRAISIWCQRFTSNFATAPLS